MRALGEAAHGVLGAPATRSARQGRGRNARRPAARPGAAPGRGRAAPRRSTRDPRRRRRSAAEARPGRFAPGWDRSRTSSPPRPPGCRGRRRSSRRSPWGRPSPARRRCALRHTSTIRPAVCGARLAGHLAARRRPPPSARAGRGSSGRGPAPVGRGCPAGRRACRPCRPAPDGRQDHGRSPVVKGALQNRRYEIRIQGGEQVARPRRLHAGRTPRPAPPPSPASGSAARSGPARRSGRGPAPPWRSACHSTPPPAPG